MAAGLAGELGESRRGGRGALRLKRGVRPLSRKSLIVERYYQSAARLARPTEAEPNLQPVPAREGEPDVRYLQSSPK
jgi:hypothetical protein